MGVISWAVLRLQQMMMVQLEYVRLMNVKTLLQALSAPIARALVHVFVTFLLLHFFRQRMNRRFPNANMCRSNLKGVKPNMRDLGSAYFLPPGPTRVTRVAAHGI